MSLENKSKLTIILETVALLTAVFTPVLFFVGHFSAYLYYSSFNIPYFKYTDTYTAFSFPLESIDVVLSVVAIVIVVVISFFTITSFPRSRGNFIVKKVKFKYWLTFIPRALIVVVLLVIIVNLLGGVIISSDLKKEIKEKRFIPFEITYNQGKSIDRCVTSIGSLGQFQVFVTKNLQPFLIQEDSLIKVKQLFSSPPLKVITMGQKIIDNPNYDAELKVWYRKWIEVCGTDSSSDFELFEFTTDNRRKRPQ